MRDQRGRKSSEIRAWKSYSPVKNDTDGVYDTPIRYRVRLPTGNLRQLLGPTTPITVLLKLKREMFSRNAFYDGKNGVTNGNLFYSRAPNRRRITAFEYRYRTVKSLQLTARLDAVDLEFTSEKIS